MKRALRLRGAFFLRSALCVSSGLAFYRHVTACHYGAGCNKGVHNSFASLVWHLILVMRRKFALVYNARAGVARPKLLDGVLAALRNAGADVFQLAARNAEEAATRVAELAQSRNHEHRQDYAVDAVIAAGGDGTFRAVAAGAAGTGLPLGFVPLGTGNVLAYELGIRKRAAELAHGLQHHPVIPIDGGLVNGAPFFLMVGAGFDAHVVHGLNYRIKRLIARAAYAAPVIRTLSRPMTMFDVDVDGRSFPASWVIVTRASHYGGSFVMTQDTQIGANQMIAVIINARTRASILTACTALALGRLARAHTRPQNVTVIPASCVKIGGHRPVAVQIDGDEGGSTPIEIFAGGPRVHLIVPPRYVADLTDRHTNHVHS